MENLKRMPFSASNVLIYVRTNDYPKYKALSSLQTLTIAPALIYAAVYPVEKIERIKLFLRSVVNEHQDTETKFQIRSAKDRKTVLFQIN